MNLSEQIKLQASPPTRKKTQWFIRHVAIPHEHGSWVFLFSPLIIGLAAGKAWNQTGLVLALAALAGFMARQPLTVLIKILSKRRPQSELPAALLWLAIYGVVGLAAFAGLVTMGMGYLAWLAVAGLPVLVWHLWLVSRRAERKQAVVEVAGAGVLALAAPAAYWAGLGAPEATGWLLWGLCWLQAGASILYAYLRLDQRRWPSVPAANARLQAALPVLAFTSTNLVISAGLAIASLTPTLLPLAFAAQWLESLWGAWHPAVKVKPTMVGIRQLIVSTLFTVLFVLLYR